MGPSVDCVYRGTNITTGPTFGEQARTAHQVVPQPIIDRIIESKESKRARYSFARHREQLNGPEHDDLTHAGGALPRAGIHPVTARSSLVMLPGRKGGTDAPLFDRQLDG